MHIGDVIIAHGPQHDEEYDVLGFQTDKDGIDGLRLRLNSPYTRMMGSTETPYFHTWTDLAEVMDNKNINLVVLPYEKVKHIKEHIEDMFNPVLKENIDLFPAATSADKLKRSEEYEQKQLDAITKHFGKVLRKGDIS